MKWPGRWIGGCGKRRFAAGAKNSSEVERTQEESEADIRSGGLGWRLVDDDLVGREWEWEKGVPMQVELNMELMRSTGIASSVEGGDRDDVSCIISGERA